jgi:zinc transporter ZupT
LRASQPELAAGFRKLYLMGLFTVLAIALAIAIHNIPEGVEVSIPIFYATGNREKAFVYSFLSGLVSKPSEA